MLFLFASFSLACPQRERMKTLNFKCYEKQGILESGDSVRHLNTDSSIDCDGNNQLHGARTHIPVIGLLYVLYLNIPNSKTVSGYVPNVGHGPSCQPSCHGPSSYTPSRSRCPIISGRRNAHPAA